MHAMERLLNWAGKYIDLSSLELRGAVVRWLEQISRTLLSWGAQVVSNTISFLVEAVVAFFTLFFLFREGGSMKEHARAIVPLRSDQVERLFTGVSDSIVANVYGCLAVGAAQGTLVSLAFWVLAPGGIHPDGQRTLVERPDIAGLGSRDRRANRHLDPSLCHLRTREAAHAVSLLCPGGVKAFDVMGLFIGPVVLSVTLVLLQMLQESKLGYFATHPVPGSSVRSEES